MKKILNLFTAFIMTASLFSCNNEQSFSSDEDTSSLSDTDKTDNLKMLSSEITTYYDKYVLEGCEDFSEIEKIKYSGEKLYLLGKKKSDNRSFIFSTDPDTLETSQIQGESNSIHNLQGTEIYKDGNGNLYRLYNGSIEIYDKDENHIKTINKTILDKHEDTNHLFFKSIAVSENGEIYIASQTMNSASIRIIKLSSSFELQYITPEGDFSDCGDYIHKIYLGENGNPVLCTYSSLNDYRDPADLTYINEISSENGITVLRYELPMLKKVIGGTGKYNVIYLENNTIFGYDYSNDTTTQLYSVDNSELTITSSYISDNHIITQQYETIKYETVLGIYSKNGKKEKTIELPEYEYINQMEITPDGTVFFLINNWENNNSDEDLSGETEPEILRLDEDGKVVTVYKGKKQPGTINYVFGVDSQKNICICDSSYLQEKIQAVYIDSAGKQTGMSYDVSGNPNGVVCINDELNILFSPSEDNFSSLFLLPVDKDTLTINKSVYQKLPSQYLIDGSNGFDFYYLSDNDMFGYRISDSTSEKILSYTDSNITSISFFGAEVAVVNPENIFYVGSSCIVDDYFGEESESNSKAAFHLKKADEVRLKELSSRKVITLAGTHIPGDVLYKIKQFNKINDDYFVMATDYSQFNSEISEDNSVVSDKIKTDIVQGNIPDIVLGDGSDDILDLLNKDTFADLNNMLKSDPDIDNSNLADNILDACKYNGKQYAIPLCYNLTTFSVSDDCNQNKDALTFNEFFNLADNFTDRPLVDCSREDCLNLLISLYINDYFDYDKFTCNFQTDIFKKILEKTKKCLSENTNSLSEKTNYLIQKTYYEEGIEPLPEFIFKVKDINDLSALFVDTTNSDTQNTSYSLCQFPSSSGLTAIMNLDKYICIANSSENKDIAWEFIKYLINIKGEQNQYLYNDTGMMSVLKSKNNSLIDNMISVVSDTQLISYSQKDIDKYTDSLNTVCSGKMISSNTFSGIYKIISEQADRFYNGEYSVDEAVSAIQNKVNLYLSEN